MHVACIKCTIWLVLLPNDYFLLQS